MFEGVPGEPALYMSHIDGRVKPDVQEEVAARAFEALCNDGALSSGEEAAASLLLGQYTILCDAKEEQGYPLSAEEALARGVELSLPHMQEVVEHINRAVKRVTKEEELRPSARSSHRAGGGDEDTGEVNGFSVYRQRMSEHEVLASSEQRDLGYQIQAGRVAQAMLDESVGDADGKLKADVEAGKAAHEKLVVTNLRLAVSRAAKYSGSGVEFDDLLQEANLALLDAAWTWRPAHESQAEFSTYACMLIDWRLSQVADDNKSSFMIPRDIHGFLRKRLRAIEAFAQSDGRYPSEAELQQACDWTDSEAKRVNDALKVLYRAASLPEVKAMAPAPEEYEGDDHGVTVYVNGHREPVAEDDVEQSVMRIIRREVLDRMLRSAGDNQAAMVRMRYGLGDLESGEGEDIEHSLAAIGKAHKKTKEGVRKVINRTLGQLDNSDNTRLLADFLS